ncbi:MAG: hypothetical protein WCL19_01735 [Verrucomicrobiota bacterium]
MIATPRLVIAMPRLVIATPRLVIARPRLVIARPRLDIATPRLVIAWPRLVIAWLRLVIAWRSHVVPRFSRSSLLHEDRLKPGTHTNDASALLSGGGVVGGEALGEGGGTWSSFRK